MPNGGLQTVAAAKVEVLAGTAVARDQLRCQPPEAWLRLRFAQPCPAAGERAVPPRCIAEVGLAGTVSACSRLGRSSEGPLVPGEESPALVALLPPPLVAWGVAVAVATLAAAVVVVVVMVEEGPVPPLQAGEMAQPMPSLSQLLRLPLLE